MQHLLDKLFHKGKATQSHHSDLSPPQWTPAVETTHEHGKYQDATFDEYEEAERFCARYRVEKPKLLLSNVVERLSQEGCKPWGIKYPASSRFEGRIESMMDKGGAGVIKIFTDKICKDVCLFSDLPIMAGLYDTKGKQGVYYEVVIRKMGGIIAIGSTCLPYPEWRFPGWNRLSVGLHLDDFRKFFEDPEGGREYESHGLLNKISSGDSIGFGYEFASRSVFFTYNGARLPTAFSGVYVPREKYDVYAAIGVEGQNEFEVNFGTDVFRWKEGNDWAWRVEGHVGNFAGSGSGREELPSYEEAL
ncbi:hypothetical protein BJ322DRAFT_1071619 [Thelephora terrestris]|uniref:B30.2/SPRY domain-containing protein n=1 Tax=Thelephora terrestris TaxID=56493 RepID=A0A9P6HEJ7_9AGAM|nr:hypothetical protein BJ322DRAFT_1071619 [Thelephora terrestris]